MLSEYKEHLLTKKNVFSHSENSLSLTTGHNQAQPLQKRRKYVRPAKRKIGYTMAIESQTSARDRDRDEISNQPLISMSNSDATSIDSQYGIVEPIPYPIALI